MNKLLLMVLLVGCSSHQILDSLGLIEAKRIGTDGATKPNFYIQNYNKDDGRSIASISGSDQSLSNKQVYFLSLYQQYHQLRSLVEVEANERSCPAFHDEILTFKSTLILKDKNLHLSGNFSPVLEDPALLPSYPVMSLPFDGADVYTYLATNPQVPIGPVIKEALYNYTFLLDAEIEKLCNTGVSNNYFIYENFVAFAPSDAELDEGHEILAAALKIPVFANILILDSLRQQTFIKQSLLTEVVMARASFVWFKNYLYELEKLRNHKSKLSYLQKSKLSRKKK